MDFGQFGVVGVLVSPSQVLLHALADFSMIVGIAVFDDEIVSCGEVTFEPIHPRRVGGGEDRRDLVSSTPLQDRRCLVRRQIVHDDVDPLGLGIAEPNGLEEIEYDGRVLLGFVMHPQDVLMDVIGSEEIADAAVAAVGGSMPDRALVRGPGSTGMRLDLDRSQFVEADYDRVFRRPLVESVDAFFLETNSGAFDSFQVRVR